jgi:predicted Fe-Mo cluster-binding NifX family protein
MKIAVTSTGSTLDDNVEARFGRCAHFVIIDTDTMQYEAIENPNIALGGGAGIQSAQLMSEKGVTTVLGTRHSTLRPKLQALQSPRKVRLNIDLRNMPPVAD